LDFVGHFFTDTVCRAGMFYFIYYNIYRGRMFRYDLFKSQFYMSHLINPDKHNNCRGSLSTNIFVINIELHAKLFDTEDTIFPNELYDFQYIVREVTQQPHLNKHASRLSP